MVGFALYLRLEEKPVSDTFELELETMANGGSAIGRHEGRVVFVPYTIPGERIEARETGGRGRVVFAEGVTLLDASADRVFPACKHFGPRKCGGCQWQHIDYAAQLLLKQDVLGDQLERVGDLPDVEVRPVVPSPAAFGYNYHMTFIVRDGQLGFKASDGNRMIPVDVCEVLHPHLLELYELLDFDAESLAELASVRLQMGSDGARMLVLTATVEEAPSLELDLPASINLLLPDNAPINLAGDTAIRFTVKGRSFRATAGSAFRANVEAVPALVDAVLDALGPATSVLDLYAGVGVLGAFIADRAEYVTVVESYPPAATDADENTADFEHVDVIEGTVEEVLQSADASEYDAAVLDPPGSGLSTDAMDALAALELSRLVYVSSDPATLARDAKRLRAHGYAMQYAQPLDLAPQTYYIETVALFQREVQSARLPNDQADDIEQTA